MIASMPSLASSLPAYHSIPSSSSSAGPSTSYARHTVASASSTADSSDNMVGSHRTSWPPLLPSMDANGKNGNRALPFYQPRQNHHHHHQERSSTSPTPSSQSSRSGDDAAVGSNGTASAHPLYSRPAINTQDSSVGALASAGSGRKRKRLQRACVPCHKAKRRCDGGLPCSNCDFSGRSCSYSDSQGNAVQPTARARPSNGSSANGAAANTQPQQIPYSNGNAHYHHRHHQRQHSGSLSSSHGESHAPHYTHSTDYEYSAPHDRVQRPKIMPSYPTAPTLSSNVNGVPPSNAAHFGQDRSYENMQVFRTCAPFNSILPEMFFTHQARPSHILSLAIESFVSTRVSASKGTDTWSSREEYTNSVLNLLIEGDRPAHGEHASTERALALVLLALHDLSKGKTLGALTLSTAAVRMVQDLGLHEGATVPGDVFHPTHCARLVCIAYTVEVIVTAVACKPSCLGDLDFAIATSMLSHMESKNGDHHRGGDRVTTAFSSLLRASQVFAGAIQHQRRLALQLPASDKERSQHACQEALNTWATSLPSVLTFNDVNLSEASRSNGAPGNNSWAWAWSMMHTFAEMTVCILENDHNAYNTGHQRHLSNGAAGRRGAASNNLAVLLDTFDDDTRRSVFALAPVLFAAHAPGDASLRVSSYLAAVRDNVALNDDQLRRTMMYLGANGTVNGSSSLPTSATTTSPPVSSLRIRSSSFASKTPVQHLHNGAPPFSPHPMPVAEKVSTSPGHNGSLPALRIPASSPSRHSIKLPSLSPRPSDDRDRLLLPSITTTNASSSPPSSSSTHPSYLSGREHRSSSFTGSRSDDRTLPPLTTSVGSGVSIAKSISPIPSFSRVL
ncbi:unnamed protein product [Sympodiomycopsis kandeliae]